MENGQYVDNSLWFYAPNKAAPIFFAIFFAVSGSLHFYQSSRYTSWRITWIYTWSSLVFIGGYCLRAYGAWHYDNINIFIASLVLLYAAPPLYELGNYLVLSRCLHYMPHLSPLHPDRTLTLFLGLSLAVEVITANGASKSITGSSPAQIDIGKGLLKAALVLQLGVMGVLLGVAGTYQRRASRAGILTEHEGSADIKNVLLTLYGSCVLITIRTIYRTVEYFAVASLHPPYDNAGSINPIIRYEWFFWVFEGMLMALNSALLNARHPGRYLPRRNNVFLRPDGTESVGVEFKDRRPWYCIVFDPLDIFGLVMGRDKKWWLDENLPSSGGVEGGGAGRKGGEVVSKESSSVRS